MNCRMKYLVTYKAYGKERMYDGATTLTAARPIKNMSHFEDMQKCIKKLIKKQNNECPKDVTVLNIQLLNSGRKIRRR